MIGTTAALIAGSAIAAGSQVASSAIASKGAKAAAKTQAQAAQQAGSDLKDTMAPYLNTGAQAMSTLGTLMGLGGGGGQSSNQPPPLPMPTAQNPYAQRGLVAPQAGTQGAAPPGYFGDYRSSHAPTSDPQAAAMQQSQSSYSGQNGAPQLVRVFAPNGEMRLLPRQIADQAIAAGAREA